jgi:D-alanyl-D-alanine carboxypeptidase
MIGALGSAIRKGQAWDRPAAGIASARRGQGVAVFLAAVLVLLAWLQALAAPAWARQGMAAIAVDARTGRVLYARNADAPRIPASITKVMTVYLIFSELRAGRLSLNTRIRFSRHAASRPPSKLGLRPGQSITVDQAIRALITKSANDVAAAVAEHIAGTESAFARRMTRVARAMGMTRTTFRNASGLPTPPNVTTARDLATLSLRIQRDFPRLYRRYFSLRHFRFRGRVYRNHNRLLGRVAGVDGLKTGYTRAAGYNLAATARRNGRRVVAVVLGMPSSRARNAYMTRLLERMFRRRDLARGTRIAALAGTPPGLSQGRMRALVAARGPAGAAKPSIRSTGAKRLAAARSAVPVPRPAPRSAAPAPTTTGEGQKPAPAMTGKTPILPRPRPALVALMAANRQLLAAAPAPARQRRAPSSRAGTHDNDRERPSRVAAATPAPAPARKETPARKTRADEAAPGASLQAAAGTTGRAGAGEEGRLFVAVRPRGTRDSEAAPQKAEPAASRPPATLSHENPETPSEGYLAMQVRPQLPPRARPEETTASHTPGAASTGSAGAETPARHRQTAEAGARPAAKEAPLRIAQLGALAFAPVQTARIIQVDPRRREMVVSKALPAGAERSGAEVAERAEAAKAPRGASEHAAGIAANRPAGADAAETDRGEETATETPAKPVASGEEEARAATSRNAATAPDASAANRPAASTREAAADSENHDAASIAGHETPRVQKARKDGQDARIARYRRSWNIQLGAFPAEQGARERIARARRALRGLLGGRPAYTMRFQRKGRTYFRARFAGFDRRSASRACRALRRHRIPCFAIAPGAGDS